MNEHVSPEAPGRQNQHFFVCSWGVRERERRQWKKGCKCDSGAPGTSWPKMGGELGSDREGMSIAEAVLLCIYYLGRRYKNGLRSASTTPCAPRCLEAQAGVLMETKTTRVVGWKRWWSGILGLLLIMLMSWFHSQGDDQNRQERTSRRLMEGSVRGVGTTRDTSLASGAEASDCTISDVGA